MITKTQMIDIPLLLSVTVYKRASYKVTEASGYRCNLGELPNNQFVYDIVTLAITLFIRYSGVWIS